MRIVLNELSQVLIVLFVALSIGCLERGPDRIKLETALKNTEAGKYELIVVSEEMKFVSFQASADQKKQYFFRDDERERVFREIVDAVSVARRKGFLVETNGLESP